MTKAPNRQVSLDSRRIHLEREIAIRVPQFDSFVTEYSGNISTTGMFILTDKPQARGTELAFEFSVADDWKLIRGKARVVWARYQDEGPDRPPGMGVRFVELDAQSRRLIRWIVEKHIREGGKPFELEELRSVIDDALDQVLDEDQPGEALSAPVVPTAPTRGVEVRPATTQDSSKQVLPLLLTAAGVVALVAALFWLTEWLPGRSRSAENEAAATAAQGNGANDPATSSSDGDGAGADGAETAAAGSGTAPDSPDPETSASPVTPAVAVSEAGGEEEGVSEDEQARSAPVGSAYRAVRTLVESWAEAWSDQDVNQYLSFYSQSFRPGGGQSRAGWAATRRDRLRAPRYIKVAVSGLETERIDNNRVRARFFQSYRSDRFNDSVRKTLELVWEEGTWKIAREAS